MRKFSDSVKFSISGGGGSCTYQLTPCHDATGSWRGMLWPYYPKHRVPGYPFKYSTGTRVQKYPKVRALEMAHSHS